MDRPWAQRDTHLEGRMKAKRGQRLTEYNTGHGIVNITINFYLPQKYEEYWHNQLQLYANIAGNNAQEIKKILFVYSDYEDYRIINFDRKEVLHTFATLSQLLWHIYDANNAAIDKLKTALETQEKLTKGLAETIKLAGFTGFN